jgi:hypothetical protein
MERSPIAIARAPGQSFGGTSSQIARLRSAIWSVSLDGRRGYRKMTANQMLRYD